MFKDSKAFSGFSVDDIPAAKDFYEGTLGVEVTDEPAGLGLQLATGGSVFLYPKDDHEPASFTVLNFPVEDVDAAVDALVEKGVSFERYDGWIRTSAESSAPTGPGRGSPGSRTRRATSCPCSRARDLRRVRAFSETSSPADQRDPSGERERHPARAVLRPRLRPRDHAVHGADGGRADLGGARQGRCSCSASSGGRGSATRG